MNALPSSEHSKLAFVSLEENAKLAVSLAVEAGGLLPIVVSGSVSITHV